jgi:hypothetical protein
MMITIFELPTKYSALSNHYLISFDNYALIAAPMSLRRTLPIADLSSPLPKVASEYFGGDIDGDIFEPVALLFLFLVLLVLLYNLGQ